MEQTQYTLVKLPIKDLIKQDYNINIDSKIEEDPPI